MSSNGFDERLGSKKKFGTVKSSVFSYVTFWMIGMIVLLVLAVAFNFEPIKHNFVAGHKALNGMIIGCFVAGLIQATWGNFQLYYVGKFLRTIDALMERGNPTPAEVDALARDLEGRASLLNTKSTYKLLYNLREYGHILVTDTEARLIKSKFGYRTRAGRGSVSFLTGILVMFGLIGTFWGLLETIGAVANALDSIAQSSNASAGAADMDMGAIIGAISGPLQGMGLAFSASLFGLASSLLLGFYTHVAAAAQNSNIEDVSRWLDDRIVVSKAKQAEKGLELKSQLPMDENDLKSWIASFAYLSSKTEQKMIQLADEMKVLHEGVVTLSNGMAQSAQAIQGIYGAQQAIYDTLQQGNTDRTTLVRLTEQMDGGVGRIPSNLGQLQHTAQAVLKEITEARAESDAKAVGKALNLLSKLVQKTARGAQGANQDTAATLAQNNKFALQMLSEMGSAQQAFIRKMDQVLEGIAKREQTSTQLAQATEALQTIARQLGGQRLG